MGGGVNLAHPMKIQAVQKMSVKENSKWACWADNKQGFFKKKFRIESFQFRDLALQIQI